MTDLNAAWLAAMRRGNFDVAWAIGDQLIAARPSGATCWRLPRHEQWVWDGASLLDRHVLVRCYHGLGDTLQFARFLPRLRALAATTTVWAQPWLIPLLETIRPSPDALLPLHDGDPGVAHDVDIEIMELAHALRATSATLAAEVPYLHVVPARRLSDAFSVGVVAQAGDWDERRSIALEMADLRVPGVEMFDLQVGEIALPGMRKAGEVEALDLAARLRSLDLVITVDTMMAHLAGALGVPTWVLLAHACDWRWMNDRRDSPWYPTLRLFRQPAPGAWAPVLAEVRQALHSRVMACAR